MKLIFIALICASLAGCSYKTIEQVEKAKQYCASNDAEYDHSKWGEQVVRMYCKKHDAWFVVPESVYK